MPTEAGRDGTRATNVRVPITSRVATRKETSIPIPWANTLAERPNSNQYPMVRRKDQVSLTCARVSSRSDDEVDANNCRWVRPGLDPNQITTGTASTLMTAIKTAPMM